MKRAYHTEEGELGIGSLIIVVSLIVVSAVVGVVIYHIAMTYKNNINSTENTAHEYSIGCFEISKIYGIRGINGYFYNGLIGVIIDAKLVPTVHEADLRYIAITLKTDDGVKRYTLSPKVSISDTYQTAILKATNTTYAVYLSYRSQDSPWYPEKDSYVVNDRDRVEFVLLTEPIKSGYSFILPYVETHPGVSVTGNNLYFNVYFDNTVIQIDKNHDGVPDVTLNGNRGDLLRWNLVNDNSAQGAQIYSNNPVNIYYSYNMADFGTYEDGIYSYTLLSERLWGAEYYIPLLQKRTIISSATNGNLVKVDINGDGTPDYSKYLNEGESWKLTSLPVGSKIWSTSPITVIEINEANNYYDNTSAFTLLPTNELSREYFVPKEHTYIYRNSQDYTKIYILAVQDNTHVYIDENGDGAPDYQMTLNRGEQGYYSNPAEGAKIYSTSPIYAIYKFDVYGQDPWTYDYRHYVYTYSLIGASFGVQNVYLGIVGKNSYHVPDGYSVSSISAISLDNSNTIKMDYDLDGTWDRTDIANYGGVVSYGPEYHSASNAEIKATGNIIVYKSHMGWWNQISEKTNGWVQLPDMGHGIYTEPKNVIKPSTDIKIYIQNTITSAMRVANVHIPDAFTSNEEVVLIYSSGT